MDCELYAFVDGNNKRPVQVTRFLIHQSSSADKKPEPPNIKVEFGANKYCSVILPENIDDLSGYANPSLWLHLTVTSEAKNEPKTPIQITISAGQIEFDAVKEQIESAILDALSEHKEKKDKCEVELVIKDLYEKETRSDIVELTRRGNSVDTKIKIRAAR
jgi:hypothetical protein